jgi:hypothetical protein
MDLIDKFSEILPDDDDVMDETLVDNIDSASDGENRTPEPFSASIGNQSSPDKSLVDGQTNIGKYPHYIYSHFLVNLTY